MDNPIFGAMEQHLCPDVKIEISYDEYGTLQAERDRFYSLAKTYKEAIEEQEAENKILRDGLEEIASRGTGMAGYEAIYLAKEALLNVRKD